MVKIVVFVDIPDPDNLLMILKVLRSYGGEGDKCAIVLTPRVLDLRAPPYGIHFEQLRAHREIGLQKMMLPISRTNGKLPEWLDRVPDDLKHHFYQDDDATTPSVREDTLMYMQLSVLRIMHSLDRQNIPREWYSLYWDQASLTIDKMGDPSMRHAFHKHDFSYDFSEEEMDEFEKAVQGVVRPSIELRGKLSRVCQKYITRQLARLGRSDAWSLIDKFSDLTDEMERTEVSARLIIGGPLSDPLKYLQQAPLPSDITAMAGSITGKKNIFKNQFNIHADPQSASTFFKVVMDKRIPTKLVPTECVKESIYEFTMQEYETISKSAHIKDLIWKYSNNKSVYNTYPAFDLVVAIAAERKDIFTWSPVKHVAIPDAEGYTIISFTEVSSSCIEMAKSEEEHMLRNKNLVMEEMSSCIKTDKDV